MAINVSKRNHPLKKKALRLDNKTNSINYMSYKKGSSEIVLFQND